MTATRRALPVFVAFTLLAFTACSPASNSNTANGNAGEAKPAAANTSPASRAANTNTAMKSKPGTGTLDVQSLPAGAGITLVPTGEESASAPKSYGQTPTTINDLAPGKYTVDLNLRGYKRFRQEVEVKADSTARVKAALKR